MKKKLNSVQSETIESCLPYVSSENQQQMLQLSLLNEIGQKIAALKPLDQVLQQATQLLHDSFEFHHVALFLLENNEANLKAVVGSYANFFPLEHKQPLSQGIIGWVATNGKLLVANEVKKEPLYISLIPDQTETQSEICVPIQIANSIVGVLDVQSPQLNAFDEHSIITLQTVANQLAVAVQNANLYDSLKQELEDRKQTQKALHESETRYRSVIDAVAEGIVLQDRTGTILTSNKSAEQILGLTQDQLMGRTSVDPRWRSIHEDGSPFAGEDHPAMVTLRTGEPCNNVIMGIHKPDGTLTWITINSRALIYPDGNKPYAVVASFSDITSLKSIESSLRKSEERFRGITERSPDLILIVDSLQDEVVYVNNHEFLGYAREDLQNDNMILDIIAPSSSNEIMEEWQLLTDGMSEYPIEYQLNNKTGGTEWVHCRNAILARGEDGQPQQVMLIITNVTRNKNIEQAMQEAQKLESLGVMASGIAHDFNNLLTAIMAENSLALLKLPKDDAIRNHIEKSQQVIERATQLTYQLLDYAGKKDIELDTLDINILIEQNAQMFQVSALKNISLQTNLTRNLPLIIANEGQMQQIIMNLIINAADSYEGRAGKIEVMTDIVHINDLMNSWDSVGQQLAQGQYVRITIRDQGRGMDEDTIKQIFDPFFTTKESGQGLGLATVYGIVRSYQGAVKVSSQLNVGTQFQILLPVKDIDKEELSPAKPAHEPIKQSDANTILVVEDEVVIRNAIAEYLRLKGFIVLEAQDGHEALSVLSQHKDEIGLVLLDMTMPVLSGEETLQEMKARGLDIPVVVSSGFNEVDLSAELRESIVVYLKKPFKIDALLDVAQSIFGRE